MTEDAVVKKIEKLLELGKSTNANEAAAAMAKAAELMGSYGISQMKLDRAQITEARVRSRQSVSNMKDWERYLVIEVAKCFACRTLWMPGSSARKDYWGRYLLVGPRDYVKLAEYAADSLLARLDKAKIEHTRKLQSMGYRRSPAMSSEIDGFCWGWVETVGRAVARFASETSAELKALVDQVSKDMVEDRVGKRRQTFPSDEGYRQGVLAGGDVEVARPMTAGDGPALIR